MPTIRFLAIQKQLVVKARARTRSTGFRRRTGGPPGWWLAGLLVAASLPAQDVNPAPPPPPPVNPPANQPVTGAGANTPAPQTPAGTGTPAGTATAPATGGDPAVPTDPTDPATDTLLPDIPPGGVLPFGVKDLEKRKSIPYREPSAGDIASDIEEALDEVSVRRITLMEAVQIALLNDPVIRLAEQEVAIARAAWLIARGSFDPRLITEIEYERRRAELSEAEIAQQQDQVDRNKALILATRQERKQLQGELNQLESGGRPANATVQGELEDQLNEEALELLKELAVNAGLDITQLEKIGEEITQQGIDTRREVLQILEGTERNARKQLDQFPVNSVRVTETATFNLSILKQFRNGVQLGPYWEYDNAQTNLQRRGGANRVNRSEIGLDLIVPLGRGRGTIAASGHEMAAQIDVEASQLSLQHTVAERVFAVVSAYWTMAAAQEELAYLVRSEVTSAALSALTESLIQADEVPSARAHQPWGRRAQASALRIQGEIALERAQQNLALLMGVEGMDIIYAPLAADPLPSLVSAESVKRLGVPELVERAFTMRADSRAARKAIDSGRLLSEQARLNVKPRVDLNMGLFYTGRDEEGSKESYYHYLFEDHAGPGFSVSLRMDWPFFLREAKGNLAIQRANLESRRDQMLLINNQITSGITQSHFVLRATARELAKQQEAVSQFEKALATEREGFRLGISTMVDTIQTEERLTEARSQLVFSRLQHALALARLRFETGTLMPHEQAGQTSVIRANFVTLPVFGPAPVDDAIAPRSGFKNFTSSVFGETDPHRVLKKLDEKDQRAAGKAAGSKPPPSTIKSGK